MGDVWIVETLHVSPQCPHGEWIEWPAFHSPIDAEWKAEYMIRDFPGIVTDYVIIRRETTIVDHIWGRYGDEYSRG